ncbi:polyprenyl synthetase family protein [Pseudactinotalea sp.]|uniref:polyprenyl synthetase family protein n=1 Tax=Pseudactinotalea sp. TaxID=1926260 RepID=UPI003B3AA082
MSAPAHENTLTEADTRAVAATLDRYFERQIARADHYGQTYRRLWEATRDAARGGKRLRPALLLLAYRHLAGETGPLPADVLELAAALELLHTAFVIHDDVIDHDLVRRGRPNVAGRAVVEAIDAGARSESASGYGQASAILAGDLLISSAHTMVAGLRAPASRRRALLELLDDCVLRTAAGEHADVWLAVAAAPSEETVISVVENKTAGYSFATPLQAGAILAGAHGDTLAGLGEVGHHLGIAFQLRDDVLGVFGDEHITGKSAISDLREGKETLLVAYARRHPRWPRVQHHFGRRDLDERSADQLRRAIRDSGALARVEQRIDAELDRARSTMRALDAPHQLFASVIAISDTVRTRQR